MATEPNLPRRCRLSVAMIVRNEEDVLAATIQSARSIADEILVLDTGSTDQSPAVAERMGAAVSQAPWEDDFSAARNRLLAEVTGDWVLWLDAGERLASESAGALRRFVDEEADPQKVYLVTVEVPPADPGASGEQAAQARLMPRHPDVRFTGRVRETVEPSVEAAGLAMEFAPGRIVRHRRHHDPRRKARNARRDLKLVALEAMEGRGPQPRLCIALGEACSSLGDQAAARQAFRQALRDAPRGSTEMLQAYYGLLATFDGHQARRGRQVALCLEALEIYPLDAQLLCAMGSYLLAQDRLDLAARAFEAAVRHGKVDPRTWHLCEIAEMAAALLSLALRTQGNDDQARCVLEEALACRQGSLRLRRHLIDLCVKTGRTEEAVRLADAIPMEPNQREPFRMAVRGASKAAAHDRLGALGLLQSAYVAGCCDPFCLRWLSVTLLSNGQPEAARPVLDQWLRLEPGNAEVQAYLKALEEGKAEQAVLEAPRVIPSGAPRWIRVDPGTTVIDVTPAGMPIICQASSMDSAPHVNR